MTDDKDGRERILQVARRCFARWGFEGTSTRKIASEANVAQSLILYHFATKEELWRSVMVDSFLQMIEHHLKQQPALTGLSPKELFKASIRTYVESTAKEPDHHRLMVQVNSASSDRLNWIVDNYVKAFHTQLMGAIRAGQAAGFVKPMDPTLIYYSIIALAGTPFIAEPEIERLGADKSGLTSDAIADAIFALIIVDHDDDHVSD
ncbi:MAG: TetR/AcrR family transcriptional regulator [Hyphomicrobiaceae bacterium]